MDDDLERLNDEYEGEMDRREKRERRKNKPMYASNVDRAHDVYKTMVLAYPSRAYRVARLQTRESIDENGYRLRSVKAVKKEPSSDGSEHESAEDMPPPSTVPGKGRARGRTPAHTSDEDNEEVSSREKNKKGTSSVNSEDKQWSEVDLTKHLDKPLAELTPEGLAESSDEAPAANVLRRMFEAHLARVEEIFLDPKEDTEFGHDFMVDDNERIVIQEYKYPKKSSSLDTEERVKHIYESGSKYTHWYSTRHCPRGCSFRLLLPI